MLTMPDTLASRVLRRTLFGSTSRPYRCFVPQSVKVYPVHQALPTIEPPAIGAWHPTMAPDTARLLRGFGEGVRIGRQLYIHVPFCPAFCHFCCLYKTMEPGEQGADFIEAFVRSLLIEIEAYAKVPAAKARPVTSIYFGGGTPTMLSPAQIDRIVSAIFRHLPVTDTPEITFEGMAHQLKDRDYLRALCGSGVNRISYGVQTFQPHLRKQLGRLDTVRDIVEAAEAIQSVAAVGALNFELLIGIPGQNLQTLLDDLAQAVRAAPSTMDLLYYNAIPGTKYYDMIRDGSREPQVVGDALLEMRLESIAFLRDHGYFQSTGEIFDRTPERLDDFNATHYGGTTGLDEMVALGPSSYGFLDGVVYQNVASAALYIRLLNEGRLPIRAYQPISARQAKRRGLLFGLQLRRIRREAVGSLWERLLIASWVLRGLVRPCPIGWEMTETGKAWYNMMQLEAMPFSEADSAVGLVLDESEQRRLLFRPSEARGNVGLARELERMIEGPVPLLRPIRRLAYKLLSRTRRKRVRLTFTGPLLPEAE